MDWSKEYKRESKASWEDITNAIRDSVSMDDVLDVYATSVPRRNHRMPCPIHDGKDPNFSYTPKGYKCFVCGSSGDVISFVKDKLGLATRGDAMKRLNADLHLNLPLDTALTSAQSAEIERRRADAEKKRRAMEEWQKRYWRLLDAWIRADKERESTDPLSDEYTALTEKMQFFSDQINGLPEEPRW